MCNRDSGDGWLVIMFVCLLISGILATQMEQPAKVVPPVQPVPEIKVEITCPTCLDVPEGIERVRQTTLLEGPTIEYPTSEYAAFLRGRCEDLGNPIGGVECRRVNALLEEGRRYLESMVNPIYGHGEYTPSGLARVRHAASQTMRLVRHVEEMWVGTRSDRLRRERYQQPKSQEAVLLARFFFMQKLETDAGLKLRF